MRYSRRRRVVRDGKHGQQDRARRAFPVAGLDDYWRPTVTEVSRRPRTRLFERLTDFGDLRLESMDSAGIARSVLSIAGPGVQAERDAATATPQGQESNDFLAAKIAEASGPLFRLRAHLAMQEPPAPPTSSSAACANSSSAAP